MYVNWMASIVTRREMSPRCYDADTVIVVEGGDDISEIAYLIRTLFCSRLADLFVCLCCCACRHQAIAEGSARGVRGRQRLSSVGESCNGNVPKSFSAVCFMCFKNQRRGAMYTQLDDLVLLCHARCLCTSSNSWFVQRHCWCWPRGYDRDILCVECNCL